MRALIRWSQSTEGCLILTLGIAAYYLAIYRPLRVRTEKLDAPLQVAWRQLEDANRESLAADRLDLDHIARGLKHLESNLQGVTNANQQLFARIAIDPSYQARTRSPFQLIDFQNERQSHIESLNTEATAQGTKIEPAVFLGFPQHNSEQPDPQYIWTELALTEHLIRSLIAAKVGSIDTLTTQRQRRTLIGPDNRPTQLTPFRVEVNFQCSSDKLERLLLLLPSRAEEIREGLGIDYPSHKPCLYVDQILIKKDSTDRPTWLGVWMKVVGFIHSESTADSDQTRETN